MRRITCSGHWTPHVHSSLPLHSGHLDIRVLQDKRCKSKKIQKQNYKKVLAIWTLESCKTKHIKNTKSTEKQKKIFRQWAMEKGVFRTMCEGSAHLTDDGSSEKARHIVPLDPILVPLVQNIVRLQFNC